MGGFSVASIFSELANGACFALVPHYSLPHNVRCFLAYIYSAGRDVTHHIQGFMSGLVGAFGSLGGVFFVLIFRLQTQVGKACWIIGAVCMAVNALLIAIRVPTS